MTMRRNDDENEGEGEGMAEPEEVLNAAIEFVRDEFPEHYQGVSDPEGDARVQFAVQRAASWGFTSLGDVLKFVALMVEVSPSFDEQPELRQVLEAHRGDSEAFDALFEERYIDAWEALDEEGAAGRWPRDPAATVH